MVEQSFGRNEGISAEGSDEEVFGNCCFNRIFFCDTGILCTDFKTRFGLVPTWLLLTD